MNGIDIFIDESGDFGAFDNRCPYYIVTMVFHESSDSIFDEIQELEYRMSLIGFENHCIHSSPAIRGEDEYRGIAIPLRRKLLSNFLAFIHHCDLRYKCFFAEKRPSASEAEVVAILDQQIGEFINANFQRLSAYARITVAYDKGQKQISHLIAATFGKRFPTVRLTKMLPIQSRLSQVADFVCTLKKAERNLELRRALTKSETVFFGKARYFRQFWMKSLSKREWK